MTPEKKPHNLKKLPEKPQLGILKREAKILLREWLDDAAPVLERLRPHHDFDGKEPPSPKLVRAQFIIAREYGFSSWNRLREKVLRMNPDRDSLYEQFLRRAINARPDSNAWKMLETHPWLKNHSIESRLVCGDPGVMDELTGRMDRLTDSLHWYPLMMVCFSSASTFNVVPEQTLAEMAKLILESGADVNATVDEIWIDDITPWSSLFGAVGVNDYPLVTRVLMDAGANVIDGETLYHGPQYGHMKSLQVLGEYEFDAATKQKPWNNTPLYFQMGNDPESESYQDSLKGIEWLLQQGADPNVYADGNGDNALHAALRFRHSDDLIRRLIDAGGDPMLENKDGFSVIQLAVRYGRFELAKSLASQAGMKFQPQPLDELIGWCCKGDSEKAGQILKKNPAIGSRISKAENEMLVEAATMGNDVAVNCLLKIGASPDHPGPLGGTALHWAAWHGYEKVTRTLVNTGKCPDIPCEAFGCNPMGWVAHGSSNCHRKNSDHIACARLLIDAGFDINFVDKDKDRPLGMASDELRPLLRAAGGME